MYFSGKIVIVVIYNRLNYLKLFAVSRCIFDPLFVYMILCCG